MSRQLLERIRSFAQEHYPIQMNGLIAEINIELAKPEPEFIIRQYQNVDGFWKDLRNQNDWDEAESRGYKCRALYGIPKSES